MSLNNFIPTVWSEALFKELDKSYCGVKLCNREYEGLIKAAGDTVKINGIGAVTVASYTKNSDIAAPETLTDNQRTLTITEQKYFNFQIDDVDKAQQKPKVMQAAMKEAADALADTADQYVYTLTHAEMATITNAAVTSANIVSILSDLRKRFRKNNVKDGDTIYLEVSPDIEEKLVLAKILRDTDNSKALARGYLGSFMGFEIYTSNNIPISTNVSTCQARTKRAVTFAEQINDVEAYRPEKRFADAVKGLHVYGGKIIYPKEIIRLALTPAAETNI